MRRLIVFVLTLCTLALTGIAPAPVARAAPLAHPVALAGYTATATVSTARPVPNSNVTVTGSLKAAGKPVAGALMTATWRYKSTTSTCTGVTTAAGVAHCTRKIARSTPGYPVKITVTFTKAGKALGQAVTAFTPR